MVEVAAGGFTGRSGDGVHGPVVALGTQDGFDVRTIARHSAITAVHHQRGAERGRVAVMTVNQIRPFVAVAVATQHQVDPVVFENRERVLAHFDQRHLDVGVVHSLGVGRVVPVGDDPVLRRRGQIVL